MNYTNSKDHKLSHIFSHVLNDRIIRRIKGRSRVLPDFIIFGTVRSGTTSLYYNICEHPCIEPADYDEIGFFDSNYKYGINWYKSHFPTISEKNNIKKREKYFLTGEDTPFYFWDKKTVKRISELLPNVKLIAILRNPVDRTYSNYHLGIREGTEKLSFEEVITNELEQIKKQKEIVYDISVFNRPGFYIVKSIYVEQLKMWFGKFLKDKIFITSTEDLAKNPQETLSKVFKFLNVPDKKITNIQKRKVAKYPEMKVETRKFLLDFFKPYNEQLFKIIGTKFEWNK